MKRFLILSTAVFAMFLIASCGGSDSSNDNNNHNVSGESGFNAVDVGECRFDEPAFSFKDRIYTEPKDEFSCKEYVEVTEKKENTIKFNWFGEMRCGEDWEYGYKVVGIENNVLKVNILERDTNLDLAADCDSCCYLMPIEYAASTAEEINSIKAIEINYEGKNHKVTFQIKEGGSDSSNGADFDPIDLGACIYEEPTEQPAVVTKDKIYPETQATPACHDYLEVKETKGKMLSFEWYGEFPCGDDWEFGYEINGVKENILEVSIKQHDTDPDATAKCTGCCHIMPMVYEGKSEEETAAIKGIRISYENYETTFEF